MASLGETFVTKSYVKGKKMPGMKKKAGEYDRIWRPKSKSSEGPKKTMPRKAAVKKTMQKRGMR